VTTAAEPYADFAGAPSPASRVLPHLTMGEIEALLPAAKGR